MRNETAKHREIKMGLPKHVSVKMLSELGPDELRAVLGNVAVPSGSVAVVLREESFIQSSYPSEDHLSSKFIPAPRQFEPIKRKPSVTFVEPPHVKGGKLVASGVTIFQGQPPRPFYDSSDYVVVEAAKLAAK